MMYTKRKKYSGRWLVKMIETALIFGIIFYSLDVIGQLFVPTQTDEAVILVRPIQQEVIQIEGSSNPLIQLDAEDYFYLALDHQQSGEYYDAVADYSRSIELNDDTYASWLNRGVAYEQMGSNSRAISDFNAYLTRDNIYTLEFMPIDSSANFTEYMYANYRYDIPLELRQGDVVSISVTSLVEEQVDPIIVLVDASGHPVAGNDDMRYQDGSLVSMNSYINSYDVTSKGEYTLMISHAGGGSYGDIDIDIRIDS